MDTRIVVSWIGVFALAMGSLISVIQGGFLSSLFGVLFLAFLISSIIPLPLKLATRLPPRLLIAQKFLSGALALIGTWTLAGFGGWEFVPAAIILSVSLVAWPVIEIIQKRRNNSRLSPIDSQIHPMSIELNSKPAAITSSQSVSPPEYTSTVKIIQEECKSAQSQNQPIIQTPVFNV